MDRARVGYGSMLFSSLDPCRYDTVATVGAESSVSNLQAVGLFHCARRQFFNQEAVMLFRVSFA